MSFITLFKSNIKLEMVFIKHSAPNHMLAPIMLIQPQSLLMNGGGGVMGGCEPRIEEIVEFKKIGGRNGAM